MSGRFCRLSDMGTTRLDPSKYTIQIQKGTGDINLIRSVNEGSGTTNVDVIYKKNCETLDQVLYSTTGYHLKKGGAEVQLSELETGDYVQLNGQVSVFQEFDELATVDNTDIRRPIEAAPTPKPIKRLISNVTLDYSENDILRPKPEVYAQLAADVYAGVLEEGTVVFKAPMGMGKSTFFQYDLQAKVNATIYITLPTRVGAQNLY